MSTKLPSTLSEETLVSESRPASGASNRGAVSCLSIVAHRDPGRLGERALLTALLMRRPFELARGQGRFAPPCGGEPEVLGDRHLSRTPIVFRAGAGADTVRVEAPADSTLLLDGRPIGGRDIELDARALARGCLLRLSSRTALLLHRTVDPPQNPLPDLLGESDEMRLLRARVLRAAGSDAPVLVTGESGTGKELVARALHEQSERRTGPFVAVNMATLTDSMAPSALFGHARGAFTGADARHRGLLERAHGGVLFLDEIGETPAAVQPMLLRALETSCYTPVGAEREQRADVRIVAATDADLQGDVEAGRFRRALFHRLSGRTLHVPPLRERRLDIPLLLAHFLEAAPAGSGAAAAPPLRGADVEQLLAHPFPGNVRELRNVAQAWREGEPLETLLAGRPSQSARPPTPPGARRGPAPDEASLLRALRENDFQPDAAARQLGVPSGTMHYFIARSSKVRRARDVRDGEIIAAMHECSGDPVAAARLLEVSARGLRMVIKQRGLTFE